MLLKPIKLRAVAGNERGITSNPQAKRLSRHPAGGSSALLDGLRLCLLSAHAFLPTAGKRTANQSSSDRSKFTIVMDSEVSRLAKNHQRPNSPPSFAFQTPCGRAESCTLRKKLG